MTVALDWAAGATPQKPRCILIAAVLACLLLPLAAISGPAAAEPPLAATPAWTGAINRDDAEYGWSVDGAGDVNGDGYGDVIVGAYAYANEYWTFEGRAFLFLGSAAGLGAAPAWTGESGQQHAHFGYSVAGAGDVNADGYDDVIVGMPMHSGTSSGTNKGRACLYLGSAAGLGVAPAWTAEGSYPRSTFGEAVAAAGDVNGDGYDDVVIGSMYDSDDEVNRPEEGNVVLYLGSASGLRAAPAWTARGGRAWAFFGRSIAGAGDVNGDGFADVIVGATGNSNDPGLQQAFLYLGSAAGLAAVPAWTGASPAPLTYSSCYGWSVAGAGDVNRDGYDDVIVGAVGERSESAQADEGRSYLYLGSATGLGPAPSWMAESNRAGAQFGYSVAGAGDVNHDGYDDVVVGAMTHDSPQESGRAYLYLGSAAGLAAAPAWTAAGGSMSYFGCCVAGAGDVNHDGSADVVVGAVNSGRSGQAFLFSAPRPVPVELSGFSVE